MKKGFTLIEMLLVIGIIGILAVLIIAVLNPIEQIRRAQDTTARQDAAEFVEAAERFYAVTQFYPWQDGENDTTPDQVWIRMDLATWVVGTVQVLDIVVNSGELKEGYQDRVADRGDLYFEHIVNATSGQEQLWGCFVPRSLAFSNQAEERCVAANQPTDYATQACNTAAGADCANSPTSVCVCVP